MKNIIKDIIAIATREPMAIPAIAPVDKLLFGGEVVVSEEYVVSIGIRLVEDGSGVLVFVRLFEFDDINRGCVSRTERSDDCHRICTIS